MHSARTIRAALDLVAAGATATEAARHLGVPRRTVADWLRGAVPRAVRAEAECVNHAARLRRDYVYLLGLYLGDGWISAHRRDVYRLRIALDVRYPGIIASAVSAVSEVRPGPVLTLLRPQNCVEVSAYWKCWPCVFPQHGAGRKHRRPIVLTDWQRELADRWPGDLIRGLIHSDGCRFQNTGRGHWSCPRYSFSNRSSHIRDIFSSACDALGVRWTAAPNTIYVAQGRRRAPRRVHRAEAMSANTGTQRSRATAATASRSAPRSARPPPGCGRRASASPMRGGCGRFRARGRGLGRARRRSSAVGRRAGPRARGA